MAIYIQNVSDLPEDFTTSSYTITPIAGRTRTDNGASWSPTSSGSFLSLRNDGALPIVSGQSMVVCIDLQNVNARYLVVRLIGSVTTNFGRRWINLADMSLGSETTPTGNTRIEETIYPLGDGWSRYYVRLVSSVSEDISLFFYMVLGDSSMTTGTFDVGKVVNVSNSVVALSGSSGDINQDKDMIPFLTAQGFTTGSLNDRKLAWLRAFFGVTTGSFNDLFALYKQTMRDKI